MKLQVKSTIAILTVFFLSGLLAIAVFNRVLLEEFRELELAQATSNTERAVEAWRQEIRSLISRTQDWSFWDDTYRFVDDHYEEYIQSNLVYSAVETINFEHIIYLDRQLRLSYGVQLNKEAKTLDPVDRSVADALIDSGIFRHAFSSGRSSGGFLRRGGKSFLVAASPIRDSAEEKAPNGILIFTREITDKVTQRIADQTRLGVRLSVIEAKTPPSSSESETSYLTGFSQPTFQIQGDHLESETLVRDLLGAPLFALQISLPRDIFHKGLAARTFLASAYIIIAVLTATMVITLIHFLVLSRLSRLSKQLTSIAQGANFSGRVSITSGDELGELSSRINDTLSALDIAQGAIEMSRAAAEAANQAKSSFIAKVSHELRTPIHSITGMLRILLKSESSNAKRSYISLARDAAYGLLETINEILDFSKAEADKLHFEHIHFNLRDVLRETLGIIGPRAEEKGSPEILAMIAPQTPDGLIGDPHRLKQILVNLMGNASKFTKSGWVALHVSSSRGEGGKSIVHLKISDTGIGIPADRLETIFEPFAQADNSVSRLYSGTGLGLTIVKQIVEGMGGAITVESTINIGSTFTVSIPFETSLSSVSSAPMPHLSNTKIALINGGTEALHRYEAELKQLNYEPTVIETNDSARLAVLRRSLASFGLIIIPSEALRRSAVFDIVAEAAHSRSVPVVALLSPADLKLREQLSALRVPFVLTRPITLEDILGVVAGTVQNESEQSRYREDRSIAAVRPLRILIADDVLTNRIILEDILKDAGHSVTSVVNGLEMVERYESSLSGTPDDPPFDLILTDIQMPLMDGLSATTKIRQIESQAGGATHLPVIAITAHALKDEDAKIRAAGVDGVVTKPLDPARLAEVMSALTPRSSGIARCPAGVQSEADLGSWVDRIWYQISRHGNEINELFSPGGVHLNLSSVLDIQDVYQRSGSSIRRTLLIFGAFAGCFEQHLTELREARSSGNLDQLQKSAHTMKGMLLDIGAKISADVASSIEQMCRCGKFDEARPKAQTLVEQVLIVARLVGQISAPAEGADAHGQGALS